jgi:hypothetical protein
MDHADRLQTGPWGPRSGRFGARRFIDEPTAGYRLHGLGADEPTTSFLELGSSDGDLDDPAHGYRGSRRASRQRTVLVVLAVLTVIGAVLLVYTMSPRAPRAGRPVVAPSPSPAAVLMAPITYQADAPANTLTGSARMTTYPGASDGVIVQTLGNWGAAVGDGALRFNDVTVPATGDYVLTFYYVHPNNESTRSVVITASGAASVIVTVPGNSTCCSSQLVRVTLNRGVNTITFSNPRGHAPAIDRIVIGPLSP